MEVQSSNSMSLAGSRMVVLCQKCQRIQKLLRLLGHSDFIPEHWADELDEVTEEFIDDRDDWYDQDQDQDQGHRSTVTVTEDWDGQGTSVTLSISANTKCELCQSIWKMLGSSGHQIQVPFAVFPTKAVRCLRASMGEGISIYLQPNGVNPFLTDVLQTPLSVDFARKCLVHCVRRHEDTCSPTRIILGTKFVPIYLIDLKNDCLVRASTQEEYAALSYVWGSPNRDAADDVWQCSRTTLRSMKEHGFFNQHIRRIPQTVIDAIQFAKSMGVRYLWVDRYCIVQDDRAEKHGQLRAMGSIYYFAHFVIVAAEGEGNSGLRTIDATFDKYRTPCSAVAAELGILYEPVTESTQWVKRGWTFQEWMFARRSFVFRGGIVTFQCQKCIWQEGTERPISHDDGPHNSSTAKLTIHKWPNMLYFKSLVEEFVVRELTYPCDSLDAIAGVLDALEASFPNGFLYGIPEVCFDIGLLWQPTNTLQDRTSMAMMKGKPHVDLPTWSWARWEGPLDFSTWEAAAECLFLSYYNQNIYSVTKTVDWYKVSRTTGELAWIANRFGDYRNVAQDSSFIPPAGWRREDIPSGLGQGCTLTRLLRSTNQRFTHPSLGRQSLFRFPVPLSPQSKDSNNDQIWSHKIQGRVKRAFLSVKPGSSPQHGWFSIEKVSKKGSGSQVGVVQLHDSHSEDWSNGELQGEFIAISLGEYLSVPGQSVGIPWATFDDWEFKKRTHDGNIYQFYNVLLIERCDDIAMRRGLGRVQRALWEGLNLEEVEIMLA